MKHLVRRSLVIIKLWIKLISKCIDILEVCSDCVFVSYMVFIGKHTRDWSGRAWTSEVGEWVIGTIQVWSDLPGYSWVWLFLIPSIQHILWHWKITSSIIFMKNVSNNLKNIWLTVVLGRFIEIASNNSNWLQVGFSDSK